MEYHLWRRSAKPTESCNLTSLILMEIGHEHKSFINGKGPEKLIVSECISVL